MNILNKMICLLLVVLVMSASGVWAEETKSELDGLLVRPPVRPSESKVEALMDTPAAHAAKHADPTYVCPMHPQIRQGQPGDCPICGMDLVLKKEPVAQSAGGGDAGAPTVSVSASIAQSMGIRTGKVKKADLRRLIHTVGTVQYDGDYLYQVHPQRSGWLSQIKVSAPGTTVQKGDLLFTYAVEGPGNKKLDWIYAPASGVVTRVDVREGMYVMPSASLYTIADMLTVWVTADVFPDQLARLEAGRTAVMTLDSLPGREWKGVIDSVSPELNPKTRTAGVRFRLKNIDQALKPGMLADVKIFTRPKERVLTVPREALIPAGEGYRVVKVVGAGQYQPVQVTVGERSDDKVEIIKGLAAGDEVVLSGQFMLDSESNLQASFRRLSQ